VNPWRRISHSMSRSENEMWSPCNPCDSIYGFRVQIESLRDSCGIAIHDSLYYGWLHAEVSNRGFILKEYAVNLTPGRPIQVSQKMNNS
jgi:hypothetical protein